jgi:polysaccharide deacetylase 2 family uncharacterized protein YibQ
MKHTGAQNNRPLKIFRIDYYFIYCLLLIIACSPAVTWPQTAKLAIIIDDIGYNKKNGLSVAELPFKVTLAVLPFTPHGASLAEIAHKNGKEIMLHAPMSNERNMPLGPGALTNNISQPALIDVLNKDLADIPHVKGVNNHMGSQLTQNAQVMGWLMNYLKLHNLYFVDSRTTAKTQALNQAEMHQLPSRKRDVFLDDKRSLSHIKKQLLLAVNIAKTRGSAIAIGHPYPETIEILKEARDIAGLNSVDLVLVSELLTEFLIQTPAYCPIDAEYPQERNLFFPQFDFLPRTTSQNNVFRY